MVNPPDQLPSSAGSPERSAVAPQRPGQRTASDHPKLPPEGMVRDCLRRVGAWLRRHRPLAHAFGSAVVVLAAGVCRRIT
jgi:hypothetical protein